MDWREEPGSSLMFQGSAKNAGEDAAVRGYLSARMQSQGRCIVMLNHLQKFWMDVWQLSVVCIWLCPYIPRFTISLLQLRLLVLSTFVRVQ